MRVFHLISDCDRRGAQVFALDLHATLRSMGVESEIAALVQGELGGLDVPVLADRRFSPRGWWLLREQMKRADVTIAHGSSTVLACAMAGGGADRAFIVRQISESSHWLSSSSRRWRVAGYLRRSSRVVSLSVSAADSLARMTRVERSHFSVVPNGVSAERFPCPSEEDRAHARSSFQLTPDSIVYGFVGALSPEKGADRAINAVAATRGAHLLLAGDGPERPHLEALAASVAPRNVHFLGSVEEMNRVYAACDALLLPSRGGDSMPAVIIEAAFAALPTIATDVGAISEMVVEGETGRVLSRDATDDFVEAVREFSQRPALLRELGAAALERCLRLYEIGPVAEQWMLVIRQVAGSDDA